MRLGQVFFIFLLVSGIGFDSRASESLFESVSYEVSSKTYVIKEPEGETFKVIDDQEAYDALVSSRFPYIAAHRGAAIPSQALDIDPAKSLYLDTDWRAITNAGLPRPILVTNYLYNCVGIVLMDSKLHKVGLFHLSPYKLGATMDVYLEEFMQGSEVRNVEAMLISGRLSDNLTRCYTALTQKGIKITTLHTLPYILTDECEVFSKNAFPDHKTLLENPEKLMAFLRDAFLRVAVDARTMTVSFTFDFEAFDRLYSQEGGTLKKAEAAKAAGVHVRFSEE